MNIKHKALPLLLFGVFGAANAGISSGTGGAIANILTNGDPIPTTATAGIDYNSTHVSTRDFAHVYAVSAGGSALAPGWSSDYPGAAQAGHPIFKMEIAYPTDGSKIARHEIVPRWEYVVSGVRWYAISVYIPSTWNFSQTPTIIGQLHTAQPSNITVSPPVRFEIFDHTLRLGLTASTQNSPAKQASSEQVIKLLDLTPASAIDRWHCFVARADWSPEPGKGSFKLWVNGTLTYQASQAFNAYVTAGGNYAKTGLYVPGLDNMPANQTIYTDYVYIGDEQTTSEQELTALTPCGH